MAFDVYPAAPVPLRLRRGEPSALIPLRARAAIDPANGGTVMYLALVKLGTGCACQRNYKGRLDGIAKRWWGPITVDRGVGDDASLHLVFRKPGFLGIWGDAFWFWGGFEAYGGQAMLIEWFGD